MKRKLLSGLLGAMMVLSLAACNKSGNSATNATVAATAKDYKEYITLADYKNVEVDADPADLEVTDADIQAEIDACLESLAETKEIKTGKVADGDTINLNYSGLLDGVAFVGGTATDTTYTVGGNFIEDLDRGLIGLEVGKEYEIPCTFPTNYGNAELNGKDVIFVVTVNYIEDYILPEYNDEFVKKLTADSDEPMNTTKELEASIVEYLTASKKSTYESDVYGQMMIKILDNSEIKGAPEAELNETINIIKGNAQAEFEQMGEMYGASTFEDYIVKVCGYESMEAFDTDVKEYATEYLNEKMVITIVAEEEGITVDEAKVKEYAQTLATEYGFESVTALEESYGASLYTDIRYELLYADVYSKLVSLAVVK